MLRSFQIVYRFTPRGPASSLSVPVQASSIPFCAAPVVFSPFVKSRTISGKRGAGNQKAVERRVKELEREREAASRNTPAPTTDDRTRQSVAYQEQEPQAVSYDGATAGSILDSSVSVQAFMRRIMATTAAGIGGAAATAALALQTPLVYAHPLAALMVGLVGGIGCLIGLSRMQTNYVQEGPVLKAVDSNARKAVYATFVACEGISLAPLLAMVSASAPIVIPMAGALAVTTMAGMGVYALRQPQGSLSKWGPALTVGLVGLIGVGVVNIFVGSSLLATVSAFGGVGLFAAFTAYDTHQAIQAHNSGYPDHLLHAANFFLNFVNLFVDYIRILLAFMSND